MADCAAEPQCSPPLSRRIVKVLLKFAAVGLATLIVAGLAGQITRDRSAALAVLMYLPLLPAGVAAMVLDLAQSGRALPRGRFALSILGCVASSVAAILLIGWGAADEARDNDPEVSLLHWNVQWGGGLFRSQKTWAAQRAEILSRQPDLIVLSEGPSSDWIEQLVSDLGPGAAWVGVEQYPPSRYWFKLVVCSRWPIRLEKQFSLPNGAAMSVIAEVRGRPMRLLVVDGLSNPFRSRLPFLQAIVEACQRAADDGHPYDVVVGDFNTPSRSIGFDALASEGYTLASRSTRGWRGTFPSFLPVYDIDHVWLAPKTLVRSCTLFNGPSTDHRGQFVHLQPVERR
jgi:endonuclease/exonuclease/phosphatase (EEP) superfamily protein YafD